MKKRPQPPVRPGEGPFVRFGCSGVEGGSLLAALQGLHPVAVVQDALAQPEVLRGALQQLVVSQELQALLQRHLAGRDEAPGAQTAADAVERSVTAAGAQDEMIAQASESFGAMNQNVNELVTDIGEIDTMLNNLSKANNQIVENIMQLSATTEEVTASSVQAADLSVKNLGNAENTKDLLHSVLDESHKLEQYIH